MLDHYLTIHSDGKHEIIIEKSRFICHIKRATTETEAQTFIQEIKKSIVMLPIIVLLIL